MVCKKIVQSVMAACILSSSMATVAYAHDVACPKVSDVKGAAGDLNGVMRESAESPNYFVLTPQPAINTSGYDWLLIAQAQGSSFDPAFTSGQSDVKTVTMSASPTAMEMNGMFICGYFTSSGGMTVLTVAPEQQDAKLNPATLKLNKMFHQLRK